MARTTYFPGVKRFERLTKHEILELSFDLINAFNSVKTPVETSLLLQDLLTSSEIKHLAKRLRIAKLLTQEDLTHREIAKQVKCSVATVTKVNSWLILGGEGLNTVIQRLPRRYSFPKKLPKRPIEFHLPQVLLAVAQYQLAKNQKSKIDKLSEFWKNVDNKKILDKQLKEMFSDFYKSKKT